ncbi:MAG: hypothetical protein Kow006_21850 [Gammaproteobacteria bacterium]
MSAKIQSYRQRIYSSYVQGRQNTLAPSSREDLRPREPYLKNLIRKHFPADRSATVLDLGCGHGALIHFLRESGYRNVSGIDGSPEQVAVARRLGIEGVEEGDLREVLKAQGTASLDVVVAFDVIEHFKREELLAFADEVLRVLKPGGRWIVHVPNGESPFFGRIRYGDLTHEMAFTSVSLGQLVLSSGFSDLRCYEDQPVVHGVKSRIRWVLWKMVRSGLRLYLAAETGDIGREAIFSQNLLAVAFK